MTETDESRNSLMPNHMFTNYKLSASLQSACNSVFLNRKEVKFFLNLISQKSVDLKWCCEMIPISHLGYFSADDTSAILS